MAKYKDITLGQIEACVNRLGGMEAFQEFVNGRGVVVFTILRHLSSYFRVEAQLSVTTSKEYFEKCGPVRHMGKCFQTQFLGLEVPAIGESFLTTHELMLIADPEQILAELGSFAGISISQFGALLGKMRGKTFTTHVEDRNGKMWEMEALWQESGEGWSLHAEEMGNHHQCSWNSGITVFSKSGRQ